MKTRNIDNYEVYKANGKRNYSGLRGMDKQQLVKN